MITTIHKCDRCGHEQDHNLQMWWVAIQLDHSKYSSKKEKYWCRKCCDEFNLILEPPTPKEGELVPPIITLEDVIREIIREEIQNSA